MSRKPGRPRTTRRQSVKMAPARRVQRRKEASERLSGRRAPSARGYSKAQARRKEPSEAPFPVPSGWHLERPGTALRLEFTTRDFVEAVDLLQAVADIAEQLEHHPDVHITEYNHVALVTYSHDVGHLTDRDERLANRLTELLQSRGFLGGKPKTVPRRTQAP